jgi:ferredoxin-NADP reductase
MGMTASTTWESRLAGRDEVAEGTWSFHFDKPAGFDFRPGQAIELILPDAPEGPTESRQHAFSLVSAPGEPRLTIATRMRPSAFKQSLEALDDGAPVKLDGPFGSLTLHKDRARPALLVAGGIGITPFMSMLRHEARHSPARPIVLAYSNRRPEDSAFLEELQALEASGVVRLAATMTDMPHSTRSWSGATGMIDATLLRKAIGGLANPIAYLAGPPAMVSGLRPVVIAAGVDEDDVRSEEFFGY